MVSERASGEADKKDKIIKGQGEGAYPFRGAGEKMFT
jgi:hypothetical protein